MFNIFCLKCRLYILKKYLLHLCVSLSVFWLFCQPLPQFACVLLICLFVGLSFFDVLWTVCPCLHPSLLLLVIVDLVYKE